MKMINRESLYWKRKVNKPYQWSTSNFFWYYCFKRRTAGNYHKKMYLARKENLFLVSAPRVSNWEVTIMSVFQDYHWWWRSFLTGGCTALYFFLYSIHFFYTKLTIQGTASTFLYFGYTLIMVLLFFLFTGKSN